MGWTTRKKFKEASEDAHYHNLLTTMLAIVSLGKSFMMLSEHTTFQMVSWP
jgi:hypothetical protein